MTRPPSAPPALAGGLSPLWGLPALLGLVTLGHLGALLGGFVWDDQPLILGNRWLGNAADLPALLSKDLWAGAPVDRPSSGYFRPLLLLDYSVDVAIFGKNAVWMHLRGLLWHLLAVAGLWRLSAPRLGAAGAWVACLIFGLHPVQSEAVTWIAARNDPMAAALCLWSLVWSRAPGGRAALGAGLLAAAAVASKESALLLPVLRLALARLDREGARSALVGALPLALGGVAIVGLRLVAAVDGAGLPSAEGWALLAENGVRLPLLALGMLVQPAPGVGGWALEYLDRAPAWRFALGGVGLLGLIALARVAPPGLRSAAALWVVGAGAPPVLALAAKGLFGERYLYLALIGPAWLAGAAALRHPQRARTLGLIAGIGCVVVLQLRALAWRDDLRLWSAADAAAPSPYSATSLGHVAYEAGELDRAQAYFIRALADPRPWLDACGPLVSTASAQGRVPLGVQLSAWGALRGCDDARFRVGQALVLAAAGRWDEVALAIAHVEEDPTGRAQVVRAALRLRAGDAQLSDLEAGWTGEPSLRAQAEGLILASAGAAGLGSPP